MPVLADDHVVVHRDAQHLARADDGFGHFNVGVGWCRVAGRVVVGDYDCARAQLESALDDFARVDRRMVDGALLVQFVGDQWLRLSRNSTRNCSQGSNAMTARR